MGSGREGTWGRRGRRRRSAFAWKVREGGRQGHGPAREEGGAQGRAQAGQAEGHRRRLRQRRQQRADDDDEGGSAQRQATRGTLGTLAAPGRRLRNRDVLAGIYASRKSVRPQRVGYLYSLSHHVIAVYTHAFSRERFHLLHQYNTTSTTTTKQQVGEGEGVASTTKTYTKTTTTITVPSSLPPPASLSPPTRRVHPLVLVGDKDELIAPQNSLTLAQYLRCPCLIFRNGGHMIYTEHPQTFADVLHRHFRGGEGGWRWRWGEEGGVGGGRRGARGGLHAVGEGGEGRRRLSTISTSLSSGGREGARGGRVEREGGGGARGGDGGGGWWEGGCGWRVGCQWVAFVAYVLLRVEAAVIAAPTARALPCEVGGQLRRGGEAAGAALHALEEPAVVARAEHPAAPGRRQLRRDMSRGAGGGTQPRSQRCWQPIERRNENVTLHAVLERR